MDQAAILALLTHSLCWLCLSLANAEYVVNECAELVPLCCVTSKFIWKSEIMCCGLYIEVIDISGLQKPIIHWDILQRSLHDVLAKLLTWSEGIRKRQFHDKQQNYTAQLTRV